MLFCTRERPDFLQFGLQALDDTSDPRQEAARESEKEVTSKFMLRLQILDIFASESQKEVFFNILSYFNFCHS